MGWLFSMSIKDILVRVFSIVVCLTFHELAHGYVAYRLGDDTAKRQGRLSLNPMSHIDPIGMLCMFIAGIGWAKPVPVNPNYFRMKNKKAGMALVSLAGPLSNFLMSFVCLLLYYPIFYHTNNVFAIAFCDILFSVALMGLGLGVFNLIPIPPLDGSKVIMAFLPTNAVVWIYRNEGYIRFFFLIAVFFGGFSSFVQSGMITLLGYMSNAVIWILRLVGIF